MMKSLKAILRQEKEAYKVPRCVHDYIPINSTYDDGIFKVGNRYTKTFIFKDINYLTSGKEDREDAYIAYSEILNSLDSNAITKITIVNHKRSREDFENNILIPYKNDGLDEYRHEYNDMLKKKADDANNIIQEKFITVSVLKDNIEDARKYFNGLFDELKIRFDNLGSKLEEVSLTKRLRLLHDFYRSGEEEYFRFDLKEMMQRGHNFKDYICPDSIERFDDYIKLGDKYARVLFFKDFATYIKDSMIAEITSLNRTLMFSIDILPIPMDEAIREVESRLLGIETNITNWQRRQNQNNNYSATVPYDMTLQHEETTEMLKDLSQNNMGMMCATMTLVHLADTKEQLDADTEALRSAARRNLCQLAVLKFQQMDGLNTVLPIGCRKINALRTFTTGSLAVFIPFRVQEIQETGGIYFGENAISHNLILCNMENLLNQSMFLLGVPGSGKSFFAKLLIAFLALNTDEDIVICDPEGEYAPLVKALGGEVVNIAAGGKDYLNAMDMVEGYGDNDPISDKAEFIMSLIEQIDPSGVGANQKSIIDRCVKLVYRECKKKKATTPTLIMLRKKLLEQPEEEAHDLALALELFTEGSLDVFAHKTNVDVNNRIIDYNIHDLGAQLKPSGLLTITDAMLNRVTSNWKKGKRTHIFIDEFHVVYANEFSADFFNSAWRQFRKRNAYPCAITQNVEYLLSSVKASTMLSNSEFIVMLNQASSDREELARLLNISPEQMNYITNVEAGHGLIKYGGTLIPFVNKFPSDTKLYQLMTTKPSDKGTGGTN